MRGVLKVRWNRWASPEDQGSGNIESQRSRSVDRKLRNTAEMHSVPVFPTSLENV